MKKIGLFILGLCTILFAGNFSQANDYEYTNLDITADILTDGTINVKEDFTANFFTHKHGIIRDIPLNYSVGGNKFHIEISSINVQGKTFTTNKSNGNIEIKIGDANKTVIGEQNYPISYRTYGLIKNFSGMGYAELYWNLVGDSFDTNINKIKAQIYLPKIYTGFTEDNFLITIDGKSNTVKDFPGKVDWDQGSKIVITYDKGLHAYQGITIAIKFPNNYFEFDHNRQAKLIGHTGNGLLGNITDTLSSIIGSLGIIILIIYLSIKKFIGKNKGIDTKSGLLKGEFAQKFPVIVQYQPPQGLNCAEVGLLLHRGAQAKDMLSLIYKRAAEGLITISSKDELLLPSQELKTRIIILTKNGDINGELPAYEQDLFRSLVHNEKNIISKSGNLYNKLGLASLEKYGQKNGRLKNKQNRGSISIAICILLITVFPSIINNYPGLCTFIIFLLLIYSSITSGGPKLEETEKGAKLISHILGYREFLAACDENKLRLFLEQDPLYFDKILPYAVVFGLETELLKKITPILKETNTQSKWKDIDSIFTINDIISSVASNSLPPSYNSDGFSGGSSFGGGFSSGGGGGGGGGRSW